MWQASDSSKLRSSMVKLSEKLFKFQTLEIFARWRVDLKGRQCFDWQCFGWVRFDLLHPLFSLNGPLSPYFLNFGLLLMVEVLTRVLVCHKQPLCQLRHNHCPSAQLFRL